MERNWRPSVRQQLSDGDLVAPKSMNAHLHVLEAFTLLYSVWRSPHLGRQIEELLDLFERHILDSQTNHFCLFFDRSWQRLTRRVSFGHDIEGSWLLHQAASVVNEREWSVRILPMTEGLARAVLEEGLDTDGGLLFERDEQGRINAEKHFWCQAEGVVGFINASADGPDGVSGGGLEDVAVY